MNKLTRQTAIKPVLAIILQLAGIGLVVWQDNWYIALGMFIFVWGYGIQSKC